MKKIIISATAFLTIILAGCGQIDKPLTTTNSNNQPAAQIEVQTASKTDVPAENATESKKTSAEQQTTEKTSMKTTSNVLIADTQAEDNAVSAVPENNDTPQPQAEEKQSVTESEKPVTTTVSASPETTTQPEASVQTDLTISEIFQKLKRLQYEPITCDGIPEKTFIAEDGTVFAVNFSERWVWRNGVEEAKLTDELYDALVDSEPICLY